MEKAYLGLCPSSLLVSLPPGQARSARGTYWLFFSKPGKQGAMGVARQPPECAEWGEPDREFRGWMEKKVLMKLTGLVSVCTEEEGNGRAYGCPGF